MARTLMDKLQAHFDSVFAEPSGLPPPRSRDYRITLVPGTAPVSLCPYRYPWLQKDELERQCAAMLTQGIIRPSSSVFSAPVLLVRKQDNTWRFYVDYKALNERTVKDKYSIPVVDELLDERTSSPSLISAPTITKCVSAPTTLRSRRSTRIVATLSFWSCRSASRTPQLRSKAS